MPGTELDPTQRPVAGGHAGMDSKQATILPVSWWQLQESQRNLTVEHKHRARPSLAQKRASHNQDPELLSGRKPITMLQEPRRISAPLTLGLPRINPRIGFVRTHAHIGSGSSGPGRDLLELDLTKNKNNRCHHWPMAEGMAEEEKNSRCHPDGEKRERETRLAFMAWWSDLMSSKPFCT